MRVLGRIRLSRLTDESTSAARQRELIEQWAAMHGHEVVGWAEDLDVSGSVDPFEAPELAPWLAHRSDEWDILVAWKLDRIGRRAIPLNRLFGWVMDNDKVLVCVSESIDLSNWVGRLVANVIAGVAEGELEAIRERTKASRKKLLESGRWPGGQVPYGHRPVEFETGGWHLERDPDTAPVVDRIVTEVIGGSAIEAVANRLGEDGIPSPKGGTWLPSTIWKIIESKHLLGHATYEGRTVRDSSGSPVLNAAPLMDTTRWDQLQQAIKGRRNGTPARTRKTSPLHGVVVCYECGLPLFHKIYRRNYGKGLYRYYHCRDKSHGKQIEAELVEELVEQTFMEALADEPIMERVYRPGDNTEIAIRDAESAVDELSALLATMTSDSVRKRLTEQIRALDSKIKQLESEPSQEAGWDYLETGHTYRQLWETSDTDARRALLAKTGITIGISNRDGALRGVMHAPEDIVTRTNQNLNLPKPHSPGPG